MGIAKVTRNFQVTIPKDIRELAGISVGDTVLFSADGQRFNFAKLEMDRLLDKIAGSWKDEIKGDSVDYVRGLRKGWEARRKRQEL